MKLLYFAWIREKIGKAEEKIDIPAHIVTVSDLLAFLKERGDNYQQALAEKELIQVAINYQHVSHDKRIEGADEIALFPPMTGG